MLALGEEGGGSSHALPGVLQVNWEDIVQVQLQ
jgi:hypothetical protein